MIWDKLEIYINRKELSKKAIDEVCEIIANEDYSTDEEVDSLVKVLVKLKSAALYTFITSRAKVLTRELVDKMIIRIDVRNTQKAGHIYCMAIALDRAVFTAEAGELLLKFVRANVSKKMSNQIIDGFKQALRYGYDTFLFSKFEGWTSRDINLYVWLLNQSANILNDSQFVAAAESCAKKNSAFYDNSLRADEELKREPVHKEICDNQLSTGEILNLLKDRFEAASNAIKSKENELYNLKVEIASLKAECLDLESKNKKLMALYEEEHLQLISAKTYSKKVQDKLFEVEKEASGLKEKLENVVSAYGQAGQKEIETMKENISRRLSTEYKKYLEIKSKEADIDYYEMLIFILDEVFRVLKKNGINI